MQMKRALSELIMRLHCEVEEAVVHVVLGVVVVPQFR
jgi:hypothetical protein